MPIRVRLEGGSGSKTIVTRRQLTDEQWKLIEPFLPIGEYGPYPERLRDQFEGVIWRFRTGAQWREMPGEFGPWPTVYGGFRVWRNAGVFTALLEGLIAEAARQGKTDLSLVSVDSTTVRAHHDAAGLIVGKDVMEALEEASAEQEEVRQKGVARRNRTGGTQETSLSGPNADASAADADSA
ncbi:transposase [Streptomyces bluensis]|uniref:transposase n=1 Tax=Streptomyces bluensis TaxID=33897 RepID=UPI003570BB0C